MVHFTADKEYFSKSRHFMNELRKDGTLCDITLIVGSQVLRADRYVLAAGSSYFNVLFLGQFAEASMNEINLSEVTEDMNALEMMVNFLYIGEIDVNYDNLGSVLKLSSYFIMETVLEFCKQFIVDTLSLQTCLQYYLYAMDHGWTDIEARIAPMVTTRFHDFIISAEETLNVSPNGLMCLHQNDVFQFCRPYDLLQFIVNWVRIGLTDQHISVGTVILDSVSCIKDHASLPSMNSTEERLHAACTEMISTISIAGLAGYEDFVHLVTKVRNQCFQHSDGKTENSPQTLLTAKMPPAAAKDVNTELEDVIITLSPRQEIIDYYVSHGYSDRERIRQIRDGAVYNMCAYVPSMRCWYYLKTIDDQVISSLDLEKWDEKTHSLHVNFKFEMRSDQLVFFKMTDKFNFTVEANSVILHNLNSGDTWEEFDFWEQAERHLQDNECWNYNDFCVVKGTDNTLYIITAIGCSDDGNPRNDSEVYFRCFKYEDIDQSWQIVFETERCPFSTTFFLNACISTVSNEILFSSMRRGNYHKRIFFVVNLSSESPTPTLLSDSFELDSTSGHQNMAVVEGKEQFFICHERYQDERLFIKLKYEYKYHSNKITRVESDEQEVGKYEEITDENDVDELDLPWLMDWDISDRESLWYIHGNRDSVSALTQVTVDSNRTPVIKSHTPPPFTCLIGAFAGTVTKDVLKKFQPVSFLGKHK